ncbi:MAG: GNAT family N-acetyltransferase [Syntrophobacter sp.]
MKKTEYAMPSMPAVIEPLKTADVREIGNTLAAMDPWLTLGYQPEALSHYLLRADPALRRYSLFVSDNLAGVLAVRHPWLFGPFIELIALFGGNRGKGLGRMLIEWVCAQFPNSPNLWATVSSFNRDAREFYDRLGFEQSATLDNLIRAGREEILLRKRLSRE